MRRRLRIVRVFLRRVAGAHGGADRQRRARLLQMLGDPGQRGLQVDLDIIGQRLERRHVHHQGLVRQLPAVGQAWRTRSSSTARKAVSVLPEPVGAAISVERRWRISGHAWAWASVTGEGAAEPGADGGVEAVQYRVR
jgi:hypothetical protein